ncbi:MAG: hypothetical protein ACRCUE_18840, partial [Bosea sp. (in: a-proteobacteria)]
YEKPDIETVPEAEVAKRNARQAAALAAGQVEIRTVERRQVFVGGEPVGDVSCCRFDGHSVRLH